MARLPRNRREEFQNRLLRCASSLWSHQPDEQPGCPGGLSLPEVSADDRNLRSLSCLKLLR